MVQAIEVSELTYDYPGKRALASVSFSVAEGSIAALVGPNGAGKSTLLRCLAALDSGFLGKVTVQGNDTQADPRGCHRVLGYLSDAFGLYNSLNVEQCLRYHYALHNLPGAKEDRIVEKTLNDLQLGSYRATKASVLSRGERQRLGIAQAIIHNPKVLLLDEPASGLDPEARSHLSELLLRLRADGTAIIVSSHILSELEDYSDSMITLSQGRILDHVAVKHDRNAATTKLVVHIDGATTDAEAFLNSRPGVSNLHRTSQGLAFEYAEAASSRQDLLRELVLANIQLTAFFTDTTSMQDLYLNQVSNLTSGGIP